MQAFQTENLFKIELQGAGKFLCKKKGFTKISDWCFVQNDNK